MKALTGLGKNNENRKSEEVKKPFFIPLIKWKNISHLGVDYD
jgi:hypothetical protein